MSSMTDWQPMLAVETKKPYWLKLQGFVASERQKYDVFPSEQNTFRALHETQYQDVKVVIIGQDPYHGPGQAMGLSFSVPEGCPLPPSLKNIYKELGDDLGVRAPVSGDLTHWARQGVLLLNTVLTVRSGQPASHKGKGWELFTDEVLRSVNAKSDHVVFVLWGGFARSKKSLIDLTKHTVIESAHPSPPSSYAGFFGSKPFSKTNEALAKHDQSAIDWVKPK